MWTQQQLEDDLTDIGLPSGSTVLVHASLDAIGPIEGGAETLVAALRAVLGAEGTLLVPTFTLESETPLADDISLSPDQANGKGGDYPLNLQQILRSSSDSHPFDFAETVRQHPDAFRSEHPALSFAAIGHDAEALTSHVPFHYPLGSEGPLARLHQRNGWILLIGVGHTVNVSLHLAEIWASVPYVHRTALLKSITGDETTMLGSPGCTIGFAKIEPLLRQGRILHRRYIGNAESQLMRQQQAVSMAIAMLQGNPSALLCEEDSCRFCTLARRMTSEQILDAI
ncbi:MAG: Aminoglycoside N3-acetyltransferase [Chthonomonadales bacterium]|nr:Aminoglycoside N3-acetyltransferase [Chthonomonadales bacterium]